MSNLTRISSVVSAAPSSGRGLALRGRLLYAAGMRRVLIALASAAACVPARPVDTDETRSPMRFEITFPSATREEPVDGRVLLLIAPVAEEEPRFRVAAGTRAIQVFGQNVEGMAPDRSVVVDDRSVGYPVQRIEDLPAGEFQVQAVLNVYDTFRLATGHTVLLPMDRGEGQRWNEKPGNLYSRPTTVRIDGSGGGVVELAMDQVIPPIEPPEDTEFVRHVRMRSERLSAFWGRDMYLGAHVLVPRGFDDHPEARYPLMIFHGHFPDDFGGFSTEPPDPDLEPEYSARFDVPGYNRIQQQEAYDFYRQWIDDDFPRFLIVEIQHPTPYYDDSYAVNSASQGPWGDAITYELIPYIEERFRGLGQGWARFLYGGSTGGWEALAVQTFYPDEYNGCFAACPDPVDFRAYVSVNIYEDANAYYEEGPFQRTLRPGHRNYLGHIQATMADYNHLELALGDRSRSGDQFDIWEATFSPMGSDGYPKRLWDKRTGEIDRSVAEHWREHYDLRHILERDWAELGPKLQGKIHVYCGDMDNYYLNNAVYLLEAFLERADPPYQGEVRYGDRAEHCWNGDPNLPNHLSRLRYNTLYLPRILERMKTTAPAGADLTSWRY